MNAGEEFDYILGKIEAAKFAQEPFPHLYVEDFLAPQHLELLTTHGQIKFPPQQTTASLIDSLVSRGWQVHPFPGCTTSVDEYLKCYENGVWPVDRKRLEGFGVALRLKEYEDGTAQRLVGFLNSPAFKACLERKFDIARPNRIETAIHKYLSGYEISPHPDKRSKCLTYLVNINTEQNSEGFSIHTHLMRFRNDKKFIYDFWKYNENCDTDWVPWDWCESVRELRKNNSLVMFAPSWNTLHAVKIRYDHLKFQRTQIYGNLWYTDVPFSLPTVNYDQFDIKPPEKEANGQMRQRISDLLPQQMKDGIKKLMKF